MSLVPSWSFFTISKPKPPFSQWHCHLFLGHESVQYTLITALEEQWFWKKPSESSPSPRRVSKAANMKTSVAKPAASWPDWTASEQIPPSLLVPKQLQSLVGPQEKLHHTKGRSGSEEEGSREKKIWLHIYLGQSVCSTAERPVYQRPGRQRVGICHSWVNPRTAGKSRQRCEAAEL